MNPWKHATPQTYQRHRVVPHCDDRGAWVCATCGLSIVPRPPRRPQRRSIERTLAVIRQRHSLFRLAFDDKRVTREQLRAQAVEFEKWLSRWLADG